MIPENASQIVMRWEGFHKEGKDGKAYPYPCPAGYWTIGYGSTVKPNGVRVSADTAPIDEPTARQWMELELEKCVRYALWRSPILAWYPEKLGAIASFIYNLGPGRYYASTLRRRINEKQWDVARIEIQKWVYGGGKKLAGLVARRADEARYL